jgi:hypothetical protein
MYDLALELLGKLVVNCNAKYVLLSPIRASAMCKLRGVAKEIFYQDSRLC